MFYSLNYSSPIGLIRLVSDSSYLIRMELDNCTTDDSETIPEILLLGKEWLERYFSGKDPGPVPPLKPSGTPFQIKVWNELMNVEKGELVTYSELARRIPTHARAVGQAVGKNPIPIFIPCHRVVAADGLGGYTPGLQIKIKLLDLERNDTLDFPI